ncbi:UPF0307 protein KPN78578_45570 [Rhodamnia argentea]|uniref:UPF0307 protein KPN78578_45570 n=1 Tax=Rhodamnia argentea TaxID=178133 RepID=A0ABM3H137_9MYRT|nr:UPF0307 protein KPN78578_45570 [Rhodamnia argentea]
MAHLVRPLRQWPRFHRHRHHHHCRHLSPSPLSLSPFGATSHHHHRHPRHSLFPTLVPSSHREVHNRPRGLRFRNSPAPAYDPREGDGSDSGSDSDAKKSRNQKKREARRAVRWGMELASFSNPQIKRILRVASLEQEVLDALMLAKRLGPDIREGKRRQFNYIGKLLREVEPELMDALIEATKDGDHSRLQALSGSEAWVGEDDDDEGDEELEEDHEEVEESSEHASIASRWFDGLISKDIQITNEVYSIHTIDFDRQELRKLVRNVQSIQEQPAATDENEREASIALLGAQKSLTRFLGNLARQLHGSNI